MYKPITKKKKSPPIYTCTTVDHKSNLNYKENKGSEGTHMSYNHVNTHKATQAK
jgi:hypothetical protein